MGPALLSIHLMGDQRRFRRVVGLGSGLNGLRRAAAAVISSAMRRARVSGRFALFRR
jgi:hypothetical protein